MAYLHQGFLLEVAKWSRIVVPQSEDETILFPNILHIIVSPLMNFQSTTCRTIPQCYVQGTQVATSHSKQCALITELCNFLDSRGRRSKITGSPLHLLLVRHQLFYQV